MTGLVDSKGRPLTSGVVNKKAPPPILGDSFGNWAGKDIELLQLPGGGVVQFDLSKLTLSDFRAMRDHYQVNASLSILSFMLHQSDWHIECEDTKIRTFVTDQLKEWWTPLNRSMSQANWAGYSPNIIEWDNEVAGRRIVLSKIKDMVPEDCEVNWKLVEGWSPPGRTPPKFKIFDGIKVFGQGWPTPVDNSLWYPLLMENGNYQGRKLLRPAFTSWFFSILMHLFANRYYERFGEPTPVGRAPFEEEVTVDGTTVAGNTYMLNLLQQLRSRSVVVMPNDKSPVGSNNSMEYDYDIEYLESQMRGADFERYMTRLDEEISIGLFTPILLLRTADVGSYNLGEGHERIYQIMLNSMNADRKLYIDNYLLNRMVDFNFGTNAARARIVFRKQGGLSGELIKELIVALVNKGDIKPSVEELGEIAGMTLEEIEQTVAPIEEPADPADDPEAAPGDTAATDTTEARATVKEIMAHVKPQIEKAFEAGSMDGLKVNMGYKNRFTQALKSGNIADARTEADRFYTNMDSWLKDVTSLGVSEFSGPETFMEMFGRVLDNKVAELADGK
jgi:hypothetical protein